MLTMPRPFHYSFHIGYPELLELHVQLCYYITYDCTCNSRRGLARAFA